MPRYAAFMPRDRHIRHRVIDTLILPPLILLPPLFHAFFLRRLRRAAIRHCHHAAIAAVSLSLIISLMLLHAAAC